MNETNYLRLRADLTQLLREAPEKFDHYESVQRTPADAGCIACRIRDIEGAEFDLIHGRWGEGAYTIQRFLGVSVDDAIALYTPKDGEAISANGRGVVGILGAVKQLDAVAAKYGLTPPTAAPASTFQPNESAFLAQLKAQIQAPVEASDA